MQVTPAYAGETDTVILPWVAQTLGMQPTDFLPCASMAVVEREALLAGLVFHEYREKAHGNVCEVTVVAQQPRWATRQTLAELFAYPFRTLACQRLELRIRRRNKRARSIGERLGFRLEGTLRRAYDGRQDVMIYSMLPEECRWLRG